MQNLPLFANAPREIILQVTQFPGTIEKDTVETGIMAKMVNLLTVLARS